MTLGLMDISILELGARSFQLFNIRGFSRGSSLVRTTTVRVASEPVSIETSVDASGAIDRTSWADAMRALGRLVTQAEQAGANHGIIGVAPHALGGAGNGEAFVGAVRRRFGIAVMLLSSAESVRLSYGASRMELRDARSASALIHVGDATIDVAAGAGGACDMVDVLPLGIHRLHRAYDATERGLRLQDSSALFSLTRLCGGPACARLRGLGQWGATRVVFGSDNARAIWNIARLWGYAEPDSASLDRVALHALVPEIIAAGPSALLDLGVDSVKASWVGTTAVVIDALADLLALREIRFTSGGVAEGVALDVLSEVDRRPTGTESPRRYALATAL
jgi:exopolyphosphatase/pppGpp-phosphohydrolase